MLSTTPKMKTSVIYSNGNQECERIAMLLRSLGGEFHEYVLDFDFDDHQFQMEFGSDATYPQVAIGNFHIGNMHDTLDYLKNMGLLDES